MKRGTWVLLAAVAALLAFVLLWERKGPSTSEAEQQKSRLVARPFEEVRRLERAGAAPLVLQKQDEERWSLMAPVRDRADRYAVEGFLDRVGSAELVRWVEKPEPKELGLDAPRAVWTLDHKGGRTLLELGSAAPLGAGVYVRLDGRTALVAAGLEEALLRPLPDFRAKELVATATQEVRRLSLAVGERVALAFERDGDAWTLTVPFRDAGDPGKLQGLLDDLCLCPVDSVVEDSPRDLAPYGLDAPLQKAELTLKSGAAVTVKLGKPVPGGAPEKALVYAWSSDRPSVFAVSSNSLRSLRTDPGELRSLALFRHDLYDAESIAVEGGLALVLKKDEKGMWIVDRPAAGAKADDGPAAFTALAGLKGKRAVPATDPARLGLDRPYLTLVARGKGYDERTVIGVERDGLRFARPLGREVALELSKEEWQAAQSALDLAAGKAPRPAAPATGAPR